jgi:predicted acyltransferase
MGGFDGREARVRVSVRDASERTSQMQPAPAALGRTHARVADLHGPTWRYGLRPSAAETAPAPATPRVASVDALRGFNIFWILGGDAVAWALHEMSVGKGPLVGAAGAAIGHQFSHVPWEGFTFYDFIFPLFIFVTGVAIVLSLPRLAEREGKLAAHLRVLRRALLLFALGVIYYGGMSKLWPEIRLVGVLQRIAICYLVASLLFLNLRPRGLVVAFVGLLAGYWALMTFVPVPGIGAGSFEKGRNLSDWLDALYLPGRKWERTTDPEGLLSTLPAIATCLLGVFAGLLLKNPAIAPARKSLCFVLAGAAMVPAGYLWGLQFPVIKSIWTSSYVLVAGGYSLMLLGVFHQIMDVWGWKAWATAFVWIGANAIRGFREICVSPRRRRRSPRPRRLWHQGPRRRGGRRDRTCDRNRARRLLLPPQDLPAHLSRRPRPGGAVSRSWP